MNSHEPEGCQFLFSGGHRFPHKIGTGLVHKSDVVPLGFGHSHIERVHKENPAFCLNCDSRSRACTVIQVDAEALAAQPAAPESAAAQDTAGAQDSTAPESAASKDSTVAADAVESAPASSASAPAADSGDTSGIGQAIQNMNRLFEQRRLIQAQQNQLPPPSSN